MHTTLALCHTVRAQFSKVVFTCSVAVTSFSNQNLKATVRCHTLCLLENRSNFPLQTGDCSWAGGGGRERGRLRKGAFILSTRFFFSFYHPPSYNSTSWMIARKINETVFHWNIKTKHLRSFMIQFNYTVKHKNHLYELTKCFKTHISEEDTKRNSFQNAAL